MVGTEHIKTTMAQFLPSGNSWEDGEDDHIHAYIQKSGTSVEIKVGKDAV